MKLSVNNIFDNINDFSKEVKIFINSENFDVVKGFELLDEYRDLSTFIVSQKNIPEEVATFLISDENVEEIVLPKEYLNLKSVLKLHDYIRKYYDDLIKNDVKNEKLEESIEHLVCAIRFNIKNVFMIEYFVNYYQDNDLNKELVDIYKLIFIYTLNPKYFEKIGDIYLKLEDYNSALDSYLSCAESSEETVEIYKKLAVVFEKINDNDSRLACLNHIKTLEASNDV